MSMLMLLVVVVVNMVLGNDGMCLDDRVSYLNSLSSCFSFSSPQRVQTFHGQPELERNYFESQQIVLDTLDKSFACTPVELTNLSDESIVKMLLNELLPVSRSILLL